MKNYTKNIINDLSSSTDSKNSFYSYDYWQKNNKLINRKRKNIYLGKSKNIYNKINKIQKNQNNTNKKLDLILYIIKSKLLGEYDYNYNITHYDFCIQKEIKNKEENDLNIKDDFGDIKAIKKDPYNPSNNIYKKKIQKNYNNIKKNDLENSGNLSQIINDFLYQNKNDKNNNEDNENNNIDNNNKDNNVDNNINNDGNNNFNINKDNINLKSNNNNNQIFDDINNHINLLLNNLNNYRKRY